MAEFLTKLITEEIDSKFATIASPFIFWSNILEQNGYGGRVEVPVGFVYDYESVPRLPIVYWLFAHTSKRGGTAHDYLYRKDSAPVVPKKIADMVYLEIMETRKNSWWRRKLKYYAVDWFGSRGYHKHSVNATYRQLKRRLKSWKNF